MYNDPNAQAPYGQSPYTSPYEQQYAPQSPPASPYPPTQYGPPPLPVYAAPQPQHSSTKTVWTVLGVIGGILLLTVGACVFALYSIAHTVGQSTQNMANQINATATADQNTAIADETPPSQRAEDYYLALSVQDFSNAYSYLAPNMTTSDGKSLTQSVFTQMAQTADSSEGQVTDYHATADPNNPNKVTVQVTRSGGKTYAVHLTFTQGSYEWVISSFDTV